MAHPQVKELLQCSPFTTVTAEWLDLLPVAPPPPPPSFPVLPGASVWTARLINMGAERRHTAFRGALRCFCLRHDKSASCGALSAFCALGNRLCRLCQEPPCVYSGWVQRTGPNLRNQTLYRNCEAHITHWSDLLFLWKSKIQWWDRVMVSVVEKSKNSHLAPHL